MPPFRFRLEKVLQVRRNCQRRAEVALAASRSALDRERRSLDDTQAGMAACHSRIGRCAARGMAAEATAAMGLLRQHGVAMASRALRARAAAEEFSERREDLVEARVQTRLLETLRDRLHRMHRRAQARIEGRRQDELVQTMVAHRRQRARVRGESA